MKLTVSCKDCGRIILLAEKDDFQDDEIQNYENSCSCEVDGPFQEYDEDGNPLSMDFSNIVAVKTK